ncbi:MAG: hypothetical protein ACPL07_02740 [Candidatus Bathyarchaeia archaeon]
MKRPKNWRDKGKRGEREVVNVLKGAGITAVRVPLSGSTAFQRGDVLIEVGGVKYIGEVKRRREGFKELYKWLEGKDVLFVRRDKDEWVVCMSLDVFLNIYASLSKGEENPIDWKEVK